MNEILENVSLVKGINLLKIKSPLIAQKIMPGQFVVIRLAETSERIPLTVQDFDRKSGTINIVFQEVGKSTRQLGLTRPGEVILDVVGPLGNPTEIKKYGDVICVAGGVGAPEIYPVARALRCAGNYIHSIIGARTKELLIMESKMREVSDELYITTDDGTYGTKGFVTDELGRLLEKKMPARVLAVGPVLMMKAVSEVTRPYKIPTVVSLNPIMLDGTGMCGACRVEVAGKTHFACVDGPEFDGHLVNYDLLLARLRIYLKEEKLALEHFEKTLKGEN